MSPPEPRIIELTDAELAAAKAPEVPHFVLRAFANGVSQVSHVVLGEEKVRWQRKAGAVEEEL